MELLLFRRSAVGKQLTVSKLTEHEVIGGMYDEHFLMHWEEVQETSEFEEYFVDLEDDMEKLVRVTKKFRKMMKSMMK